MMIEKERFLKQCKDKFFECYKELDGKKVVLFPAGGRAHMMILSFRELNIGADIQAVLDNNCKQDMDIEKISVYSSERIRDYLDCVFVVCSDTYREAISQQIAGQGGKVFDIPEWEGMVEQTLTLHEYKTKTEYDTIGDIYSWIGTAFDEKRIQKVEDKLQDDKSKEVFRRRMELLQDGSFNNFIKIPVDQVEYFDVKELNYTQDEVFVDCGAYIGDTIDSFCNYVGKYQKIIAIEPDEYNCKKIKEYVEDRHLDSVWVINAAVGNENKVVAFDQQGTTGSAVKSEGNNSINLIRLDDVIKEKITFLKMDIEGFELDALKGANVLITTYKPKLAICIYHKCEDPLSITEYLAKLVPEYKFYMRHYTDSQHETVLYAVAD